MPAAGAPILIVDDDPSVRASLALLLKQAGLRSVAAATGGRWRPGPAGPQLVLQDMNFPARPGEEGLGLLREIRGGRRPAGHLDDRLGLDRAGGGGDAGGGLGLRDQALDQPAAALRPSDGPGAGGHAGRGRRSPARSWTRPSTSAAVGRRSAAAAILRWSAGWPRPTPRC